MKTARFEPKKTSAGWRINVPAPLSETGARSRRFFETKEGATGFAQSLRNRVSQHGVSSRLLPPVESDLATRAFKMLEGHAKEVILDAVREYLDRHNRRLASVPFEVAFGEYIAAQTRSGSYTESLKQYRKRLAALHGRPLCEIGARDIDAAMKDFTPTVYNYGRRLLAALFNYGCKKDYCATNPIKKLDRKNLPPREVEIYAPKDAAALMHAADDALIPWLGLCMFAGLRASEARKLVWSDIDFTEGFIRVRAAVSKTHRPRAIPMAKNLKSWLLPHRGADQKLIAPQGLSAIRKQFSAAHKAAGVAVIKHGARHSYASYLLAQDGSVDALLLNMGHTNAVTTFRHYHRVASARAAKAFWVIKSNTVASGKVVPMPTEKDSGQAAA